MKTFKQKFAATSLTLLIVAASVLSAAPVFAASGSITLASNKSLVAAGGSFVVAIYMNGGGNAIYGVQADISYPSSKVQYIGFSGSGGAFEIAAANGGSDGLATIARGTTSPVSGSGLIGTATFKALAGSGNATIVIASSSSLADGDGAAVPYAPGAANVSFGSAPAAVTPQSTTSPAPVAAAAPEPPKDTTPPVISKIIAKATSPYAAEVSWTTDEAANSAVDYGVDATYGLSASQPDSATTHHVSLASAFLVPKATVHYRVRSTDTTGNVQTGTDHTLQLPGVPVTVIVHNDAGQPQAGASVTLDDQTVTTDKSGQAHLSSALGGKQIVATYQGVSSRRPVTVIKSAAALPPYRLDLARQPLNHWMVTSIGLIVVVLTLLGIDAVLFGSTFMMKLIHSRQRLNKKPTPAPDRMING